MYSSSERKGLYEVQWCFVCLLHTSQSSPLVVELDLVGSSLFVLISMATCLPIIHRQEPLVDNVLGSVSLLLIDGTPYW